jgi:hypothetical protein
MSEETTSSAKTEAGERLSFAALAATIAISLTWFASQALTYWS